MKSSFSHSHIFKSALLHICTSLKHLGSWLLVLGSIFKNILLFLLSLLYGSIILCRNKLYNLKIFKSVKFDLPVISIGNITVGGTGKTPHTEYLIRLLKDDFKVAFLSRGYKRKTRGFILAGEVSSAEVIGDEPFQIKRKFPGITVAVDSDRVRGIRSIMGIVPDIDVIILDDAFQHRRVTPLVNILLIDYNRPINCDKLLPHGLLREPASEKKRADIIVVTKIPENLSDSGLKSFLEKTEIDDSKPVFFTMMRYGQPIPVFKNVEPEGDINFNTKDLSVLLVSGIADPVPLITKITGTYEKVIPLIYPDHYSFSQHDIDHIIEQYNNLSGDNKVILTTEKDAARLLTYCDKQNIPGAWYYIPIETVFFNGEAEMFNNKILTYVNKNRKNSIFYKKQDGIYS